VLTTLDGAPPPFAVTVWSWPDTLVRTSTIAFDTIVIVDDTHMSWLDRAAPERRVLSAGSLPGGHGARRHQKQRVGIG
jgi:hypothetical protein